jgi:hypothetical protein
MDHGLLLVLIQHVHRFALQVCKRVVAIVSMKQLVDYHVLVMGFNFKIVPDSMLHIYVVVRILK